MLRVSKSEARVYIESIRPKVLVKYGKRTFLSIDLVGLLHHYFSTTNKAVTKTQIKSVFSSGGVDLDIHIPVQKGEKMYVKVNEKVV